MTVQERRARQKSLLRQEILDAARDILVKDGYANLTMRRVAEKIDYSTTAIYLHFANKNELMVAVCAETFGRLLGEMEEVTRQERDPILAVKKGLRRYVEFGLKYPQHYLATFVLPHSVETGTASHAIADKDAVGMKAFQFLSDAVAECARQGRLRDVDLDATSRALWAGVHGVTSLLIVQPEFPWGDQDKVIDTLIDSMTDGLEA